MWCLPRFVSRQNLYMWYIFSFSSHEATNKHKIKKNRKMMNTMASFKAYGKVNEADQQKLESQRQTRKRITIISLSSIVLVCVVVAAVVGTTQVHNKSDDKIPETKSLSTSVKAVCDVTLYKDSCYSNLAPILANSSQIKPEDLFKLSIQVAIAELSKVISKHFNGSGSLYSDAVHDRMSTAALENCRDLLELAIDHLNSSLTMSAENAFDDFITWLSSAVTYHDTCIEGFENATSAGLFLKDGVLNFLKNSTESTSNSLAIVNWLSKVASTFKLRRLMSTNDEMPEWLTSKDRKLLQTTDLRKKADIVVAKDGSGMYKTIIAALNAVPDKNDTRFVIYVKKGVYYENVRVEKPKWNVMMIGDGMDATIVSGSLNFIDGTPTFSTATFAAFGKGFVARDMGFRNTAGPLKHQAVALLVDSDMSVFYRCRFDAYQDTLYAHSNRQFYRECNIQGTVDFIFGNSAVIFQNCNILAKTPTPGQQNTITAQGKVDPNQNTGIVIQNCTIWAGGNLTNVKTYLGRPWKLFSTTIYMRSMIGSLIDPAGWLPWNATFALDTLFYSEYQNFGPGASTKYRVKWKGLRSINSTKEASKFTVSSFIMGDKWISNAGVGYKSGL